MNLNAGFHKSRHIHLHKCLEELLRDYVHNIPNAALMNTSILTLKNWSYAQAINPDHPEGKDLDRPAVPS